MVITKQGKVFAWGRGNVGQTGLGIKDTVNTPTCIQTLDGQHVTQVQLLQLIFDTHTLSNAQAYCGICVCMSHKRAFHILFQWVRQVLSA